VKNQQQAWNNRQGNAQRVETNSHIGRKLSPAFLSDANLHGQGTRDGAWQISGSDLLTFFETQGLEVFGGVGAKAQSTWSRCCPGGKLSKTSRNLQSKAGIDTLDCTKANLGNSKWIHNNQLLVSDFRTWNNVAKPNKAQGKTEPEQGLDNITKAKHKCLGGSKAGKNQGQGSYQVARKWSFAHTQFVSLEGAK